MLVLRPVKLTDLPGLQRLARDSLVGVTSLPDDTRRLHGKILASSTSFASDVQTHGDQSYLFVLEDTTNERLMGCSEIVATTGLSEPFYSLRNRMFTSTSHELNIQHEVPALSLCHDLNGQTLLCGFHVDSTLAQTPFAELSSRGRLLFMAAHSRRFAEVTISEIVGYSNEDDESPFWDALGKHFFDLPYAEAERLCGLKSRTFLAELMPQYPIYVPMLSQAAQDCIGQAHPAGQDAMDILLREGFEANSYVDIFDGGPTLFARTSSIRSIAHSQMVSARLSPQAGPGAAYLVSNDSLENYRAIVVELDWTPGQPVSLNAEMLAVLKLAEGSQVRLIAL